MSLDALPVVNLLRLFKTLFTSLVWLCKALFRLFKTLLRLL
jgi:hypothetical protein